MEPFFLIRHIDYIGSYRTSKYSEALFESWFNKLVFLFTFLSFFFSINLLSYFLLFLVKKWNNWQLGLPVLLSDSCLWKYKEQIVVKTSQGSVKWSHMGQYIPKQPGFKRQLKMEGKKYHFRLISIRCYKTRLIFLETYHFKQFPINLLKILFS